MAYVVVVFTIINSAALVWAALILLGLTQDIPTIVESAIQDEVRKQDDRIEKRQARAAGPGEDTITTAPDGLAAGQPFRR